MNVGVVYIRLYFRISDPVYPPGAHNLRVPSLHPPCSSPPSLSTHNICILLVQVDAALNLEAVPAIEKKTLVDKVKDFFAGISRVAAVAVLALAVSMTSGTLYLAY